MHRFCLTVGLVFALVSCRESTEPGSVIYDLDAIQVGVRVAPGTITAGASASVTVTLKNTLAFPVEISSCPIYFWVQGSGGQIVGGSNAIGCLAGTFVYMPLKFRPFETKTMQFEWQETQNVAAGVYDVFAWVNDPQRASSPARITVISST